MSLSLALREKLAHNSELLNANLLKEHEGFNLALKKQIPKSANNGAKKLIVFRTLSLILREKLAHNPQLLNASQFREHEGFNHLALKKQIPKSLKNSSKNLIFGTQRRHASLI